MIEILFLVFLCKRLGAILRAKARSAGGYQALLVVAWFAGEILGALVFGVILQDGSGQFPVGAYFGGPLGAACGAVAVFMFVRSLPGPATQAPQGFPVTGVMPPVYPAYPPGRDPGEL